MPEERSRFTAEDIKIISTSNDLTSEEVDALVKKSKERLENAYRKSSKE